MREEKQLLLIENLVSSSDTFAICQGIIKPEYFSPDYRAAVKFVQDYYEEYNATPGPMQVEAETGLKLEIRNIPDDQIRYTTDEIEKFCRQRALQGAIRDSIKLIDSEDYGTVENLIRDAILISLQHNLGLRYFETVEERLQRMLEEPPTISTGWNEVDELLYGGISRRELLLVSASSGGGKSITLANLGFNLLEQGYNVLYLSLELANDIVAQRFDTMYTGVSRKDWKTKVDVITTRLESASSKNGILDIIQMQSGTRANQIRAYLKEYYLHYKMMPDLLVVDYLDKMNPNETNINLSDVWTKDKLCSEQIRDIGVEYNIAIASASQLNRSAVGETDLDHSHIAGGISKINESDIYLSVLLTDSMKDAGECTFVFQKTRNSNGAGKSVHLKWVGNRLRIEDQNQSGSSPLRLNSKQSSMDHNAKQVEPSGGFGLMDIMSDI